MTRWWLHHLFDIWPFGNNEIAERHKRLIWVGLILCQRHKRLAKVGLTLHQILNKVAKNGQRLLKFCQSGEISSGHTGRSDDPDEKSRSDEKEKFSIDLPRPSWRRLRQRRERQRRCLKQFAAKILFSASVTRLDDFWNFLATNFQTKVVQIFCDFLGYFEDVTFKVKTVVPSLLGNFWIIWATFYSIWSHCYLLSPHSPNLCLGRSIKLGHWSTLS